MITLICQNCGRKFQSVRRSMKYCSSACANKKQQENRRKDFAENVPEKIVWASGGGIQSTAIAALICMGKLPKPDFSVMIDTEYESKATYDYLYNVTIPRLAAVGVHFDVVKSRDYTNNTIITPDGTVNIPAFQRMPDGTIRHFSTQCNSVWKTRVIRMWLKEHGVERCVQWLGISTDEARRAKNKNDLRWIRYGHPLLDLNMSREDCIQAIKDAGFPMPIRTSCFFCPQRTKFEWLLLKYECPEDFKRACEIERQIQLLRPDVFLSPTCRPLEDVVMSE